MLRILPLLLVAALWVYAFVDCLATPEERGRGLPKAGWVLIVLLFGGVLIGPVAWLVAGRVRHGAVPVAPDDGPAFLRRLAEENRRGGSLLKDGEAGPRRREEEPCRREAGERQKRQKRDGRDREDG
ncbi:PLD nuclease N-terminal domain-containing protein [Streptomyces chilikensis]|uniref:PLD nuclease N-terminal domain-containing protein n=1 Tax=Streptomyces chilikensis TaxID=1194079 RepID=A0ABV3EIF8_9ACTN